MSPSDVLHAQFPQCCAAASVPVEGDGTRQAIAVRGQCLAKECLCGRDAAVLAYNEVDGLTILIDRAIKVVPFTTDASTVPVPSLFKLRHQAGDPSQDGRMSDVNAVARPSFQQDPDKLMYPQTHSVMIPASNKCFR